MVLISHLIVPIEWVPYPQKECGYCRMTPTNNIKLTKIKSRVPGRLPMEIKTFE
jgi:hypothetical protein